MWQCNFAGFFDIFRLTKCDKVILLQSVTDCYYKVRQLLQSVTVITKWDVTTVLSPDVCILFSYFRSLISVCKKRNIKTMLTLPYPYTWQKSNNKMNEKKSQEYQSMDPEYVTGKINSHIGDLLLRRFCCLIFAPSQKS